MREQLNWLQEQLKWLMEHGVNRNQIAVRLGVRWQTVQWWVKGYIQKCNPKNEQNLNDLVEQVKLGLAKNEIRKSVAEQNGMDIVQIKLGSLQADSGHEGRPSLPDPIV